MTGPPSPPNARFGDNLRELLYVLMGNHYHLPIRRTNLVRGMTWFQTTYTVRHNARPLQRTSVCRTL